MTPPGDDPSQMRSRVEARHLLSRSSLREAAVAAIPSLAFLLVHAWAPQHLYIAVTAALSASTILLVAALWRRSRRAPFVIGLISVALACAAATLQERAQDYFLPGLAKDAACAILCLLSIIVGWPAVAVVHCEIVAGDRAWRASRQARRSYSLATAIWLAVFLVRLAVKVPLYLEAKVASLATAHIAMGWPLFAVALSSNVFILKRVGQPAAHT
jgi:hypothetical protein